jgi:pyruvate/2-oxoglutarate dehydrogenase complex dihydrolipoamide dehydrogenase (E3) component
MQPEVIVAVIAAVGALAVSIVSAWASSGAKTTMLEVKNHLLQFENTFVERLNGKYVRREEWNLIREDSERDHARFDREIQALHGRISGKG